jgi:hypothetical protein
MSIRFICDACGKSVSPPDGVLPCGWQRVRELRQSEAELVCHACSSDCSVKIITDGVRPPAPVTALRSTGNEPWRKEVADAFGGSAFLGAMAGSVLGHALRDVTPSGWARPARGEACHYFVDRNSVCGEWKGYRGAVMVKPTLNKVCGTCKEKRNERDVGK